MTTGIPANFLDGTYTITSYLTGGPVGVVNDETGDSRHVVAVQPDTQTLGSQTWEITRSGGGYEITIMNMYTIEDTLVGEVHAIFPNSAIPPENWVITQYERNDQLLYTIENPTQSKGWYVNVLVAGGSQQVDMCKLQKESIYGGPLGTPAQLFEIVQIKPKPPPPSPSPYPPLAPGIYRMKYLTNSYPYGPAPISVRGWYVVAVPRGLAPDEPIWNVQQGEDGLYTLSVGRFVYSADRAKDIVTWSVVGGDYTRWAITPVAKWSEDVLYTIQTEDKSIGWKIGSGQVFPGMFEMDCIPLTYQQTWENTTTQAFIFLA